MKFALCVNEASFGNVAVEVVVGGSSVVRVDVTFCFFMVEDEAFGGNAFDVAGK